MVVFKFIWHYLKSLGLSFYELFRGDYAYTASALAFISLFAFIPILAISIYIFSFSPRFVEIINLIQNYLLNNLLPTSIGTLNRQMHVFINNTAKLSFISILFVFVSGLSLFITLRQALNTIWKKSDLVSRKGISSLMYWLVLLLVAFFFGLNIFLGSYFFSLSWVTQFIQSHDLSKMALSLLSIIIDTLMFSLAYIFIPHYQISYKHGFIGGLTAAVLFELAKFGFGYYITAFSNYGVIYGVFAIIPIFLFWVYLSWLIVLFGAVFAFTSSSLHEARKLAD